jgi:hypothetical protein
MNVFAKPYISYRAFQMNSGWTQRKRDIQYMERLYKMGMLTKVQILEARNRRKTQIIDVPEWFENGQVIIIELSGKERDAFEADMVQVSSNGNNKINLRNIRAKLVARCVVNPDDFDIKEVWKNGYVDGYTAMLKEGHTVTRMFNDVETNDLGDVSATALQRVFEAAQRLSGITKEDVKELAGDLKNDQSADFGLN